MSLTALVAAISGSTLATSAASADDQAPRREVFSGVETASNYTTVYSGGGYAFGEGFDTAGWRLRAVGAWGSYEYSGTLFDGNERQGTTFDGRVAFIAAQAGYQVHIGRTIAKAFAGLEAVDQSIVPFDPENTVQGTEFGLRLTLETWTNLSDRWFLSSDVSYGTAFQEYWQLSRVGRRLSPKFAVGLEGGVAGNQEYNAGRGGAFIRGKFAAFETTISGGFTRDYLQSDPSAYFTMSLYRRF